MKFNFFEKNVLTSLVIFFCLLTIISCLSYASPRQPTPAEVENIRKETKIVFQNFLQLWQGSFPDKRLKIGIENTIDVVREVDEGLETLKLNLPAVVTCDLRLNEPRYASLPNIMKAKKKPIEDLSPDELKGDIKTRIEQLKVEEPPKRQKGVMVSDVLELINKLAYRISAWEFFSAF